MTKQNQKVAQIEVKFQAYCESFNGIKHDVSFVPVNWQSIY